MSGDYTRQSAPDLDSTKRQNGHTPAQQSAQVWAAASIDDARATNTPARSALDDLIAGRARAAVTFAGQGVDPLTELLNMRRDSARVRQWCERVDQVARHEASKQLPRHSGFYPDGFALSDWLQDPTKTPSPELLRGAATSVPLILTVQVARIITLIEQGLDQALAQGAIVATTGHSQGMMAACLLAELVDPKTKKVSLDLERAAEYVRFGLWEALHMDISFAQAGLMGAGEPMVAIAGPERAQLEATLQALNNRAARELHLNISLANTPTRHVVSGAPKALAMLKATLERQATREQDAKKQGRFGGAALTFTWEPLQVSGAFHSHHMESAREAMRLTAKDLGFVLDPARFGMQVINAADGTLLNDAKDPADALDKLLHNQFTDSVDWPAALRALPSVELVLDLGPGDGVMRLVRSNLQGSGAKVLAVATDAGQRALLTKGHPTSPEVRFSDWKPTLGRTSTGRLVVDNRYTRATGFSPMILPGMTPTTVDVKIVAAAANAGYSAELAGGGQVNASIFWRRLQELEQELKPGRQIIFNALYLDRYLWELHLGRDKLVQKARQQGAPIIGVTISAGIPPVEEAVALLDELVGLGITQNAFKPGTVAQVEQVCKIAQAAPHHLILMHLEGGKAGGHHSWEDLDQLLLSTYAMIRREPNIVLCVGGGIATPERAAELMTGQWSLKHRRPELPVDAILLGTVTMACQEATTSPQVKRALVEAPGTSSWVFDGTQAGQLTSGKSQLGADIHYIDNAASRAGRLLDEVAGDLDAILARRDEIVDAINATAKPYFGDLDKMSWAQVLTRLVELLSLGRHGRYEDGPWLDPSHRQRVLDACLRAQARATQIAQPAAIDSSALDAPQAALEALLERYPSLNELRLLPQDLDWFVQDLCARPGKPVTFVPIIDADVRRWYKSDSLWQAHDERFEADQVLIIPGPEAIAGITTLDEPVAALLERFEDAVAQALKAQGQQPRALTARAGAPQRALPLPQGYAISHEGGRLTLEVIDQDDAQLALSYLANHFEGPLAQLLGQTHIWEGSQVALNPARVLLTATPGATFSARHDQRSPAATLTELTWRADAQEHVVLSIESTDATNIVSVAVHLPRLDPHDTTPAATLTLALEHHLSLDDGAFFTLDPRQRATSMARAICGDGERSEQADASLHAEVSAQLEVTQAQLRAYAAQTGMSLSAPVATHDACFALVWPALLDRLTQPELVEGMLKLVHLDNAVETLEGWPIVPSDALTARAHVTRVEDAEHGRTIATLSTLWRGQQPVAQVRSTFFVRQPHGQTAYRLREQDVLKATLSAPLDQAAITYLNELEGVSLEADLDPSLSLRFVAKLQALAPRAATARWIADGELWQGDVRVGKIALDQSIEAKLHPLRAALHSLGASIESAAQAMTPTTRAQSQNILAALTTRSPARMDTYAEVSGDHNPIHRSPSVARLASLKAPIVHGMWTSARLLAALAKAAGRRGLERITQARSEFLAPLPLDQELAITVRQLGLRSGMTILEATAEILDEDGERAVVVRTTACVAPLKTAYILPGQGIQQVGMGMEGYGRSRAAREVWERADAFSRANLGFSILQVVRENPKELIVEGRRFKHQAGVLHLTQLTQVAMAVLARAQVMELKEAGAFVEGAITCGHSVGEYNSLSAILDILPIEDVVAIVYQRGMAMHKLVPRDEQGRSSYGMGVAMPHHAGLKHTQVEALVEQVRQETGKFVEIVNYNVRGRQYSVTGELAALDLLAQELMARRIPGRKAPWVLVPGIDVPFHSSVLRDGVDSFRQTLIARLPKVNPAMLEGRYIPNLAPRAFALDREWVEQIHALTGSVQLQEALDDWDDRLATDRADLARVLLIELLAWQFASPVRWIETQELMFKPTSEGGLGVERIIEIGVGYQPTAANMARASLSALPSLEIEVLNVEAERARILGLEASELEPASLSKPQPAQAAQPAQAEAPQPAPQAAPAATTQATPAPKASSSPQSAGALTAPTHKEGLLAMLAIQTKQRPEQISLNESIDELVDGVSSKRNQILMDLGAEFDVGAIDGAHEQPLERLLETLATRAARYQAPGHYLNATLDETIQRQLRRANFSRPQLEDRLKSHWGLDEAAARGVLLEATLAMRAGDSNRGGKLGALGDRQPGNKDEALALVDALVIARGERQGVAISAPGQRAGGAQGAAVDAAVVKELEARILGADGILAKQARAILDQLDPTPAQAPVEPSTESTPAQIFIQEYGEDYARQISPRFNALEHVTFSSAWAFAQRDVARLAFDALSGKLNDAHIEAELARLAPAAKAARVAKTAIWYAKQLKAQGHDKLADQLDRLSQGGPARLPFEAVRPQLRVTQSGEFLTWDEPTGESAQDAICALFEAPQAVRVEVEGKPTLAMRGWLLEQLQHVPDFSQNTALITGASPGSIALEIAAWLLRGGATVILTTTSLNAERKRFYGSFYQTHATQDAQLHVVPFNQASVTDIEALADWLFEEQVEQAGASVKQTKPAMRPDLLIPFGAMKDLGTMDHLEPKSEAALRALLLGVERLSAALATRHKRYGAVGRPLHILLPLSPNLGTFGGDGTYGEGKAALEAMLAKWSSERDAWASATTICGARIGWVRGTGLMDANDAIASGLERDCVRTFSAAEMGALLTALCTPQARELSAQAPLRAELTGGMERVANLRDEVNRLRDALTDKARHARALSALKAQTDELLGHQPETAADVQPLPDVLVTAAAQAPMSWPEGIKASLDDTVVIVGLGELGPVGSARTRFDLEVEDKLSAASVLELAWVMGLVRYESGPRGGQWVDLASGQPVPEHELAARYEQTVRERVGIRMMDEQTLGFNPLQVPVLATTYLDQDYTFSVQDEQDAHDFIQADPEHTRAHCDPATGQWTVTRTAGAEVKLMRHSRLNRRVAGALPTGFDATRFGISPEMAQEIDPVCLYNLIATVDAFISAGLTPEELMSFVHPARVGNTQGAGMGGMRSLRRMYTDHLLDQGRQSDIIQESLINVVAAYVVQSYVGSYGPMVHPVGACATAAVSLEEGLDKILADRADFIVAGAFDDLGREGMVAFGDMNATANTDEMLARGFEPKQMSRSNDRRRRGFVEAQGGGTLLLARASVALEMGLPVYGVLAWAGSYADGIHTSIPAPGQGLLAAAMGKERSPMARALSRFGLGADDIALVYKHDTSTEANDPNENALHDAMQQALGRSEGNPLWVVSQKTLTGHCKGGAASWQAAGLCQSLIAGVIPGNRNLESVDERMRRFGHMGFTDETLRPGQQLPMRAGLLTSLGFGHVSAMGLILHPQAFEELIPKDQLAAYTATKREREQRQRWDWAEVLTGRRPLFQKRTERRLDHEHQSMDEAEHALLLDPDARLDLTSGLFSPAHTQEKA